MADSVQNTSPVVSEVRYAAMVVVPTSTASPSTGRASAAGRTSMILPGAPEARQTSTSTSHAARRSTPGRAWSTLKS